MPKARSAGSLAGTVRPNEHGQNTNEAPRAVVRMEIAVRRVLVWINLGLVSLAAASAGTLSPFAFVMIDAQTEAVYGSLPFNRAVVATAIDRLTAAKAKGIVIKFFYDLPSTEQNDQALEQSICGAKVGLQ